MRFLGIDYGEKRVGIAISDEEGKFAFPLAVLENNKKILAEIKKIVQKEKVEKIIFGLPLDLKNRPTDSTKPAENFKIKLEKITELPVLFEKEFFTTKEAERIQGKNEKIDASAAALILKHYLTNVAKFTKARKY